MKRPNTDALVIALHWILAGAVLLSAATGFRIAADDPDALVTLWLRPLTLDGAVHTLHVASSVVLLGVAAGYLAYLLDAGMLSTVRVPKTPHRRGNHRVAWKKRNVRIYQAQFMLLALIGATGWMLYAGWSLGLPIGWISTLHLALVWTLIGTVGLHIFGQYKFGATAGRNTAERVRNGIDWLLKMLRPRFAGGRRSTTLQAHPVTVLIAVGAAVMAGGGFVVIDQGAHAELEVAAIGPREAPVLDGNGDDAAWARTTPVSVLTHDGANLPGGESEVQVQAASDGETMYLKFRWQDPTRSFKHLPLRKTSQGWRLLHEEYDVEDEDVHYEDKFAVLLTSWATIAGGVTHLGAKPLDDKPAPLSARGLHYTEDGSIADMWQWKAVRSQPLGGLDDDLFGPPAEPKPEEVAGTKRYKGGYVTDPGDISSSNNFAHEGPGGYRGEVRPERLPTDLAALRERLGPIDLDPESSDAVPLAMTEAESTEYSPELDATIPVGTVVPGVIVAEGGIKGDRGDVRTGARWEDGWWTLEVARALDTGSENDVAFAPGASVYLWVAVFDHTQTRHSRHLRPLEIRLPAPASA
jgi:Ethylbenzene dehydrogenase/Prokaryotic cytochrome b561